MVNPDAAVKAASFALIVLAPKGRSVEVASATIGTPWDAHAATVTVLGNTCAAMQATCYIAASPVDIAFVRILAVPKQS